MNEENLRQAILAIAVSIDFKEEEYIKRVPAGTDLRQLEDPAFFVLSNALLARFKHAWFHGISAERMGDDKGLPPFSQLMPSQILKALIHYVALELSWAVYHLPPQLTDKMLGEKYLDIASRFRKAEEDAMLTELASRRCVFEAVRNHLIKSNTRSDSKTRNRLYYSNRPEIVFNMFKEYFREHSATAFRFEGSFIDFVMNAYQNYFYANNKADIWRALNAEDFAKREVEMDAHAVRYITQESAPADMYVHYHLINIGEANVELFKHFGHEADVNGVMYDSYYAMLGHLCEQYAKKVNEKLEGFCIEYKDPYSRLEGIGASKNIGAKISNAKQVLTLMFDYIRSGNFNVQRLLDFRRECFRLGRSDTQSTNPVWGSLGANNSGESARYLDTPEGIKNYITFETVFKAVASIYNLMRALSERGRDLVVEYIKGRPDPRPDGTQQPFSDWFINNNIYRYIDYLSSLDYLPLIRRLQAESNQAIASAKAITGTVDPNAPPDLGSGELLDFEGMINLYAGSVKNTNTHINANKRYDFTHGLLDRPKLKERDPLTTAFEQKRSVYSYMTAIPYSYKEVDLRRKSNYLAVRRQSKVQNVYYAAEFPDVELDYRNSHDTNLRHVIYNDRSGYTDYAAELYKGLNYNSILAANPDYARQHLAAAANGETQSLAWHIGTCDFPCVFSMQPLTSGPVAQEGALFQPWAVLAYYHVPVSDAMVVSYSRCPEGTNVSRILWHQIARAQETAWILEGRGTRRYGSLPITHDLHALSLAAVIKPTDEDPCVKTEAVRREYGRALERLENSLGFELYIGIENLGKPEILSDVLSKINVYQDYTAQVELYRQRLVELSWMQDDYIQVLQTMFMLCWVVTLPGYHNNIADVNHAYSLFNSLMTGVFKRDDLEWFFTFARGNYYEPNGQFREQYMWPHKISDFSTEKSADGRRVAMNPRWALTLRGMFTSLIDDAGITPPTNFEDGPYEQFINSARMYEDTCERFILLHAFLYEKTRYVKLLRDAFSLTFGALPEDNNTLSCELNSILGVTKVFDPNNQEWVNHIAVLRGMSDNVAEYVRDMVTQDTCDFTVLLEALDTYYEECTNNIRNLVNYDVAVDAELSSKFDSYRDALRLSVPVTNSEILNQIRGQYVCDEHGYFLAGNDYFKADYGGAILYLHHTGNFLRCDRSGHYEPFSMPTKTSQELYEYEQILKQVMRNARYSDYE